MKKVFSDFKEENGLVLCTDYNLAKNNSEILYIHEAKKLGIDAVLFRRFYRQDENHPYRSEPAVCIFQKDDKFFNTDENIALHAKLWSAGDIQVYVIKGKTRVSIINARKPAQYDRSRGKLSVEYLLLASDIIKDFDDARFYAHLFGTGTFWEQSDFRSRIDANQSPYILLLKYLLETRNAFINSNKLDLLPETIDKLLVTCILIKFLEERDDDNGKHTLKKIYNDKSIVDFSEAIDKNISLDILNELASEFNGKIFDKFSDDEKVKIKNSDLILLSGFLRGDINPTTTAYFIWKQYDFKYLPAEVISAIYENFIQAESLRVNGATEKGIVYTPIHLVEFLIDEAMPLDKPELFANESFRVLDPTCGSGVFLVAAYKRLLQWWVINNYKNGNVVYPRSDVALRILENNIFGVDIKETATLVSIFGLTTALLDKLTPQQIWGSLKFSELSNNNIRTNNFFDWAKTNHDQTFDLVIGNPPFNPIKGLSKKDAVSDDDLATFHINTKDIPRNNFALKFFEGALHFGKKVCMIIPASILIYDKASLGYRKRLFTKYTVHKIFDFTHLRRDLFHKTADTPVLAILLDNNPAIKQAIEHTVVKRMLSSEKKIGFEIDYYDRHYVSLSDACDEDKSFIWKTNLLGGGRLFNLIYRLSLLRTLEEFIDIQPDWCHVRGFEGGVDKVIEQADIIVEISEDGEPKIELDQTLCSSNFKSDFMYSPPYIAVDQILGRKSLKACLVSVNKPYTNKKQLFYNRDFIGISAPQNDEGKLRDVHKALINAENRSKLNPQLYIISKSSSSLVLTETDINKSEILSIPFPENPKYLDLNVEERLIQEDVLNFGIHLGKSISVNGEGSLFEMTVTDDKLKAFGMNFCNALNELYATGTHSWQTGAPIFRANYVIYPVGFGKNNKIVQEVFTSYMKKLDFRKNINDSVSNNGAFFNRVIRVYQHLKGFDCLFLVKPQTSRYWLNSIALRDADDTISDLNREGF